MRFGASPTSCSVSLLPALTSIPPQPLWTLGTIPKFFLPYIVFGHGISSHPKSNEDSGYGREKWVKFPEELILYFLQTINLS